MMPMSEKVFLSLKPPTEEESLSDQQRIELALQTLGYEKVTTPLSVLQTLYPMCRNCDFTSLSRWSTMKITGSLPE